MRQHTAQREAKRTAPQPTQRRKNMDQTNAAKSCDPTPMPLCDSDRDLHNMASGCCSSYYSIRCLKERRPLCGSSNAFIRWSVEQAQIQAEHAQTELASSSAALRGPNLRVRNGDREFLVSLGKACRSCRAFSRAGFFACHHTTVLMGCTVRHLNAQSSVHAAA